MIENSELLMATKRLSTFSWTGQRMQGNANHTVHQILIEIAERVPSNSARLIYLSPEQIQKRSATKFDFRNLWSHLSLDVGGGVLVVVGGFYLSLLLRPSLPVFPPALFYFRARIHLAPFVFMVYISPSTAYKKTDLKQRPIARNRAHIKSTSLLTCTFRWSVGLLLCFCTSTDPTRIWVNLLQTSFIFIHNLNLF